MIKKTFKTILILVLMLLLNSCANNENDILKIEDAIDNITVEKIIDGNFNLPTFYEGVTIVWKSDNENLKLDFKSDNIQYFKISRSTNDIILKLKATFFYNDLYQEKEYEITILKENYKSIEITWIFDNNDQIKTYIFEGETILKPNDPIKSGYSFLGWYLNNNLYDFDLVLNDDITLVAKWEAINFSITYNDIYKTPHDNPTTINIESEEIQLKNLSDNEYYSFAGWYLNDNIITTLRLTSFENIVLEAKWNLINYPITYKDEYNTVHNNPLVINIESGEIQLENLNDYKHHSFEGWYMNNQKVTKLNLTSFDNIVLEAKWKIINYSIVYSNTFDVENNNPNYYNINSETIILESLSDFDNSYFDGWYLNDEKIFEIDPNILVDLILEGRWIKYEYKIYFENTEEQIDNITISQGDIINDLPVVENSLYKFLYWTHNDEKIVLPFKYSFDSNITLNANYLTPLNNQNYEGIFFNENSNDLVNILNSPTPVTSQFIINAPSNEDFNGTILGNYSVDSINSFNIEIIKGGKIRLFFIVNSIEYDYIFSKDIRSDSLSHLTITFDNQYALLYRNGIFIEQIQIENDLPIIDTPLKIGGNYHNLSNFYKNKIYKISLYDEYRSEDEIFNDILYNYTNSNNSFFNEDYINGRNNNILDIDKIFNASNEQELYEATFFGFKNIKIINNINLHRTILINGNTNISSDGINTLSRDINFGGDLFLIGENISGFNPILSGDNTVLNLGNKDNSSNNMLIIDGKESELETIVYGTVLFITGSSTINIYNGTKLINNRKTSNYRTLDSKYLMSHPSKIGGPVSIIQFGTLNIYGGTINNNFASTETEDELSSQGGAIYNFSNLNIYGGEIHNNNAARGGAIFNYRVLKLYNSVIDNNHATVYGGAIYQSNSQFAETIIGLENNIVDNKIMISNNTSNKSGGAIFTQTLSSLIIYGDTIFYNNESLESNAGAISSKGGLFIFNTIFENNKSASKGGAIYAYHNEDDLTIRHVSIQNSEFINNYSFENGGAIYGYNSILNIEDSLFENNNSDSNGGAIASHSSIFTISSTNFTENNSSGSGGAIYISYLNDYNYDSFVDINMSLFSFNRSVTHGGAIYVTSRDLKKQILIVNNSIFEENIAQENGGAIYSRTKISINDSNFIENISLSDKYGGGAIYSSGGYISIYNSNFNENNSETNGGAIAGYSNSTYEISNSSYLNNSSYGNGGAIYLNNSEMFIIQSTIANNNVLNSSYGGGAIYLTNSLSSIYESSINENSSNKNAGAIGVYSNSNLELINISANGNNAFDNGGFIYSSGSNVMINHSSIEQNSAKSGGAIYYNTESYSYIDNSSFLENTSSQNGGALYITGNSEITVNSTNFNSNVTQNKSNAFGGVSYITGASTVIYKDILAFSNIAYRGGVFYITTTGTNVSIDGLTVQDNQAYDNGSIIWGNTNASILNINRDNYIDLDIPFSEELDEIYWKNAIYNKITVNDIDGVQLENSNFQNNLDINNYSMNKQYSSNSEVDNIFMLANEEPNEEIINDIYSSFPKIENTSNFVSRDTIIFDNINSCDITVDTFVYHKGKPDNNPNVAQGILIYQAMDYKRLFPNENVEIQISSFRFSISAAVNINRNSRYFGYMRALNGKEYDEFGFVRISYLLIMAAKMGINVTVIGQQDAYPTSSLDPNFYDYFNSKLNESTDHKYVSNQVVNDYLNYKYIFWTSYGDSAAADMMHNKLLTVNKYLDKDGQIKEYALWMGSSNVDGINIDGTNGHDNMQTAILITNHKELYQTSYNFIRLLTLYSKQEDIILFRNIIRDINKNQIEDISLNRSINPDEQIVYLGSEEDNVFELYFTPMGGEINTWNEIYNPFHKYIRLLNNSSEYIWLSWNGPKYSHYQVTTIMEKMIVNSFINNKNSNNRFVIDLPSFNYDDLKSIEIGKDIGLLSTNKYLYGGVHNKDIQLSYEMDGQRYYTSILNSLNMHTGSMYYQTNQILVIKEQLLENSLFSSLSKYQNNLLK